MESVVSRLVRPLTAQASHVINRYGLISSTPARSFHRSPACLKTDGKEAADPKNVVAAVDKAGFKKASCSDDTKIKTIVESILELKTGEIEALNHFLKLAVKKELEQRQVRKNEQKTSNAESSVGAETEDADGTEPKYASGSELTKSKKTKPEKTEYTEPKVISGAVSKDTSYINLKVTTDVESKDTNNDKTKDLNNAQPKDTNSPTLKETISAKPDKIISATSKIKNNAEPEVITGADLKITKGSELKKTSGTKPERTCSSLSNNNSVARSKASSIAESNDTSGAMPKGTVSAKPKETDNAETEKTSSSEKNHASSAETKDVGGATLKENSRVENEKTGYATSKSGSGTELEDICVTKSKSASSSETKVTTDTELNDVRNAESRSTSSADLKITECTESKVISKAKPKLTAEPKDASAARIKEPDRAKPEKTTKVAQPKVASCAKPEISSIAKPNDTIGEESKVSSDSRAKIVSATKLKAKNGANLKQFNVTKLRSETISNDKHAAKDIKGNDEKASLLENNLERAKAKPLELGCTKKKEALQTKLQSEKKNTVNSSKISIPEKNEICFKELKQEIRQCSATKAKNDTEDSSSKVSPSLRTGKKMDKLNKEVKMSSDGKEINFRLGNSHQPNGSKSFIAKQVVANIKSIKKNRKAPPKTCSGETLDKKPEAFEDPKKLTASLLNQPLNAAQKNEKVFTKNDSKEKAIQAVVNFKNAKKRNKLLFKGDSKTLDTSEAVVTTTCHSSKEASAQSKAEGFSGKNNVPSDSGSTKDKAVKSSQVAVSLHKPEKGSSNSELQQADKNGFFKPFFKVIKAAYFPRNTASKKDAPQIKEASKSSVDLLKDAVKHKSRQALSDSELSIKFRQINKNTVKKDLKELYNDDKDLKKLRSDEPSLRKLKHKIKETPQSNVDLLKNAVKLESKQALSDSQLSMKSKQIKTNNFKKDLKEIYNGDKDLQKLRSDGPSTKKPSKRSWAKQIADDIKRVKQKGSVLVDNESKKALTSAESKVRKTSLQTQLDRQNLVNSTHNKEKQMEPLKQINKETAIFTGSKEIKKSSNNSLEKKTLADTKQLKQKQMHLLKKKSDIKINFTEIKDETNPSKAFMDKQTVVETKKINKKEAEFLAKKSKETVVTTSIKDRVKPLETLLNKQTTDTKQVKEKHMDSSEKKSKQTMSQTEIIDREGSLKTTADNHTMKDEKEKKEKRIKLLVNKSKETKLFLEEKDKNNFLKKSLSKQSIADTGSFTEKQNGPLGKQNEEITTFQGANDAKSYSKGPSSEIVKSTSDAISKQDSERSETDKKFTFQRTSVVKNDFRKTPERTNQKVTYPSEKAVAEESFSVQLKLSNAKNWKKVLAAAKASIKDVKQAELMRLINLAKTTPRVLKANLTLEESKRIKEAIESAGGNVDIVSSISKAANK